MRRYLGFLVAAGTLAAVFAVTVDAQVRWGRAGTPRSGVCFYEDADFEGDYFCTRPGDDLRLLPRDMRDRISSIRVIGRTEATVFRNERFRGPSARIANDVRNLKREGWNDSISSIRVSNARGEGADRRGPSWGNDRFPREGACFFKDRDFRGQYFCLPRGASYASMPRGFNDQISSVRLFGAQAVLFADDDFGGRTARLNSDATNLKGSWRDRVSSIRVF